MVWINKSLNVPFLYNFKNQHEKNTKKLNFPFESKFKQFLYRSGQALRVPGGWFSSISRQSAHEGGKVVSPKQRPPLPPRKYSCYSLLLEAETTTGPYCAWKDYVNEESQWRHQESNPWTCIAVPQLTAPLRTPPVWMVMPNEMLELGMWNLV